MNQGLFSRFFGVEPLGRLGQLGDPQVSRQNQVDAIKAQLMYGAQPQNVGEGFNSIAKGVQANVLQQRLNDQLPEMAGKGGGVPLFRGLANMFKGFGG